MNGEEVQSAITVRKVTRGSNDEAILKVQLQDLAQRGLSSTKAHQRISEILEHAENEGVIKS